MALSDDIQALATKAKALEAQVASTDAAMKKLQADFDAYKLTHPDTPDDPNARIVNVRKSEMPTGARLDFDTTQQVATYGHNTWTSGSQPAARRTFDLTFLPYDADIPVKVTFTDGKVAQVVIHTNPKVEAPPVPPVGAPVNGKLERAQTFAHSIGVVADIHYGLGYAQQNYDAMAELGNGWARNGWAPGDNSQQGGLTRQQWAKKIHDELGVDWIWTSDARDASISESVAYAAAQYGWLKILELDNEWDVARFGPVNDGYQLPGGTTAEQGMRLARDRTNKIMAALKRPAGLLVSSPSVALLWNTAAFDAFGQGSGVDLWSHHDYAGGRPYTKELMAQVIERINTYLGPNAGAITTETGNSTGPADQHPGDNYSVTEQMQAVLLGGVYVEHAISGRFIATCNYNLIQPDYAGDPFERGFGLVEARTWRRKPAFHVARRLTSWNRDTKPQNFALIDPKVSISGAGLRSYVTQKADGTHLVHVMADGSLAAPGGAYRPDLTLSTKRTAVVSWPNPRDVVERNVLQDAVVSSGKGLKSKQVVVGIEPTIIELSP